MHDEVNRLSLHMVIYPLQASKKPIQILIDRKVRIPTENRKLTLHAFPVVQKGHDCPGEVV